MLIADGFFSLPLHHQMKEITYHYGESLTLEGHYAVTIGFFDGVHKGHQYLIGQLQTMAREEGLQTMVITFERHPRQVLHSAWQPQQLSSLEEKKELLRQTDIDMLVVLQFDEQMAQLSAYQFMKQVLHDQLHAQLLLTGYDNRFGHDRMETFKDYEQYGKEMGIDVRCGLPRSLNGKNISSSLIRRLLNEGSLDEANDCLGRPYTLTGTVIHGHQIGRQLGFPTANIKPDDDCRLVPANGVYAVTIETEDGQTTADRRTRLLFQGMMNIGTRPTFDGQTITLEVNIFNFNRNLYDQRLTVSFIKRLRGEQHFGSPEELKEQMEHDAEEAKKQLASN